MARLSYPDEQKLAEEPLVQRIVGERGSLLNLYRMLMHSPPLAEGWLSFFTAIRQKCGLSGRIREMVILRIASIHGASYEFAAHEPFGLREGLTPTQIEALKTGNLDAFDAKERAILTYCEAITHEIHVPDAVFDSAKEHFSESEMVELTATIAAYNLVSRFLEALQVDPEPQN